MAGCFPSIQQPQGEYQRRIARHHTNSLASAGLMGKIDNRCGISPRHRS
jgi:hypothetical protein